MVFTRSKLNKLSKEGLIEELLNIDNLSEKINDLAKKMDDFATKFDRVSSELQISKTCNPLLRKRITDLEQLSRNNFQYLRSEMIQISPVPLEVSNDELEGLVCRALSLAGNKNSPDDLEHVTFSRKNKTPLPSSKAENSRMKL